MPKNKNEAKLNEYRQRNLAQYRESDVVTGVRILLASDACPACKSFAKIIYPIDKVPALPHPECTNPKACRCSYASVTKTYEEIGKEFGFDFSGIDQLVPSLEDLAKQYKFSEKQIAQIKANQIDD